MRCAISLLLCTGKLRTSSSLFTSITTPNVAYISNPRHFSFTPISSHMSSQASSTSSLSAPAAAAATAEPQQQQYFRKDGTPIVQCHPDQYESLFADKVATLKGLIGWEGPVDQFDSPRSHFRMRANFNIWHDTPKDKFNPKGAFFAMYDDAIPRVPSEIKDFPRGTHRMNELMEAIRSAFEEFPVLFKFAFEIRFVTTQTSDAVIVICYKKPMPAEWKVAAEEVATRLKIKIIGRARKVKEVAGGSENILEVYKVDGAEYKMLQTEGAFSQPNAKVCEKMLTWATEVTCDSGSADLCELYCGGGTFTAALAKNFRRVLATEMSSASVKLAHETFAMNGIENIKIARLSSEEFSEAYFSGRSFRRLEEAGINIKDYNISTVLVDPPRAGCDAETCKMMCDFDRIVYISCNPVTLARDLKILTTTHDIVRVAAFDQFPYTHHLEGGVYLVKKPVDGTGTGTAASTVTTIAAVATSAEDEDGPDNKKQRV